MSHQEKKSVVSIISTLLAFGIYYIYVLQIYQGKSFSLTDEFSFWGVVILVCLPVQIVFVIVIHIVFSIINAAVIKDDECSVEETHSIIDERERLIELKSTRNFGLVFLFGFFLSMGLLVLSGSPAVMFNTLLFSMIGAGVVIEVSKLYFYRKGI